MVNKMSGNDLHVQAHEGRPKLNLRFLGLDYAILRWALLRRNKLFAYFVGSNTMAGTATLDEWTASSDRAAELILTGILLGSVHVLTPDHLSALSALSVGGSWRSFSLGVRWSLGHSIGLLLCFAAFVAFKGDLDLHALGQVCDPIVGAFMLVIGTYGVIGSLREYHYKVRKKSLPHSDLSEIDDLYEDREMLLEAGGEAPGGSQRSSGSGPGGTGDDPNDEDSVSSSIDDKGGGGADQGVDGSVGGEPGKHQGTPDAARLAMWRNLPGHSDIPSKNTHLHAHTHAHAHLNVVKPFLDMKNPLHQRIISIAIGLLHGVAGPGGILGVLPAVEMHHWQSSVLYLGSFMMASTVSMGLFAGACVHVCVCCTFWCGTVLYGA